MRTLLIITILTAAALLPVTLWAALHPELRPTTTIIYLPAPEPIPCFSNTLWSI